MPGPTVTTGSFFDGRSAEATAVRVVSDGHSLTVSGAGGNTLASWPLAEIHVDALQDGGLAHLECAADPGAVLALEDPLFVRDVVAAGARRSGLPQGARRVVIGAGSAAGVLGILAAIYFTSPLWSAAIARRIPRDVERRLSPEVERLLEGHVCESSPSRQALDRLVLRLDPGGEVAADVRIVNLSEPNAFALPGGLVLVTRGLIDEASGPDEIAGVVAHELAHVSHRHVLAQLVRNAALGAVWAATIGDYSGMLVLDPDTLYQLASLRYSRRAEAEADATGLEMLARAGVSHGGLVSFFERHGSEAGDAMAWLGTHPATGERLERLRARAEPQGARPSLEDADFEALRKACADAEPLDSLTDLFD